jgi:hypothetical protein
MMDRMLSSKRFIAPYELTRYSTGSYHLEETMSDPYQWTSVMSQKTRNMMAINNKNQWLDQFLRTGNGLANNIFSFLDVIDIVTLRCTSRILDKFVLRYCQNNVVHGTERGVNDVAHFLFLFPQVTEISLPNFRMNQDLLTPNIFMSCKNLHTLKLRNCNFTDLRLNPESFRGLDMVSFYNCTIPEETADWNMFRCMESVRFLSLDSVTGHITGANCFKYLSNLMSLSISRKIDMTLTDDCWETIANTCPLVELFAKNSDEITDVAIRCVTRSGLLQRLDIRNCMSPLLTRECQPFLKRVPDLNMYGCMYHITNENCPECGRPRRIDKIADHLEHECDMQCPHCQETVMITHMERHLLYKCRNNYTECEDCGCNYLVMKRSHHRRLCIMRLITCDLCDDTTPYYKKDHKAHLAKNHARHCDTLTQKVKVLRSDIKTVLRDINMLISDAKEDAIVPYAEAYPAKQRNFFQALLLIVAKHHNNEVKQLTVERNLLRQFLIMRKHQRMLIEREIQDIMQEREDEEEQANSRYWDDYDEYTRRSRWAD